VYNDLMMDLGTGQYLGTELGDLGRVHPPFIHPSTPANDCGGVNNGVGGMNGYQPLAQEPSQTVSSFDYPQSCQPHRGVGHTSGQSTSTGFEGQRPTGGIVDYNAWERALYESFMMDQETNRNLECFFST